jgi:hypothetical protein
MGMGIEQLRAAVEESFANDNNFDNNELTQIVQYALGNASHSMFATGIDAAEVRAATQLLEEARRGMMTVQAQRNELLQQYQQLQQAAAAAQQGIATAPFQGQLFGPYNPAVEMSRNAAVRRQAETQMREVERTLTQADSAIAEWQARVGAYQVIERSFRDNMKWTERLLHLFT